MNFRGLASLAALVCLLATGIWGCSGSRLPFIGQPSDLQVQAAKSLKSLRVEQVAVMPFLEPPSTSLSQIAPNASATMTAELSGQLALSAEWRVVPDSQVQEALKRFGPVTPQNQREIAFELGKAVRADGVFFGIIDLYRERVGFDYAASRPAAVAFTLNFLYVPLNQVVWTGHFAKEQRALSENLFDIRSFVRYYARWVMAHEIAEQGIEEAVTDLRSRLAAPQRVKVFGKKSSYEQTVSQRQKVQNLKASATAPY